MNKPLHTHALLAALILVAGFSVGAAQSPATPSVTTRQSRPASKSFKLRIKNEGPLRFLKLSARDSNVSEIAAELSRQLEIPVQVSPAVSHQKLTVEINWIVLEGLVRFLAGKPYIDYVATADDLGYDKPLAIYLYAPNEAPPPLNATVKSTTETFVFEGNTEEGNEEYEKRKKEHLEVTFRNSRLSLRAEKQPLGVVISTVANELGIPYEFADNSPQSVNEIVSLNLKDYLVDQALRSLSPAVRFFFRSNVMTLERYPIRIVLAAPQKPAAEKPVENNQ